MLKDLRLSQQAADSADAATPMGTRATAYYEGSVNDGGKGKDFSAVLPRLVAKHRDDAD